MVVRHCCDVMRENVERTCDVHTDRFECADCLVHYSEKSGAYGLIIHDGERSVIRIAYCPWCGSNLPKGN